MTNDHFIPLDSHWIETQLIQRGYSACFQLKYFDTLSSTNAYLKSHATKGMRLICIAESQTAGKGRFGRHWASPYGENIYLSISWPYRGVLNDLSGLSLIVGLSLQTFLRASANVQSMIKWPNDIMVGDQKSGGVLIEFNGDAGDVIQTIIGIGLNINTNTQKKPLSPHRHCSLLDITGSRYDRNALIVDLLLQLDRDLQCFLDHGFSAFRKRWTACDYLLNQRVSIQVGHRRIEGVAKGINEQGGLLLVSHDGEHHALLSGEASLHGI